MCSIKVCLFRLAEMPFVVLLQIPGLRVFSDLSQILNAAEYPEVKSP
jgi:hypothetical protein